MANAYDLGLCTPDILQLAENWCDAVMRFEGGQLKYWVDFLEQEAERLNNFGSYSTLANDKTGYKIMTGIIDNLRRKGSESLYSYH